MSLSEYIIFFIFQVQMEQQNYALNQCQSILMQELFLLAIF